jgi:uncharacterized ferritin-like protein (DUF455 family)
MTSASDPPKSAVAQLEPALQSGDLQQAALACVLCADPAEKCAATARVAAAYRAGALRCRDGAPPPLPIAQPGRPQRPQLVSARKLPQRGIGTPEGRAAFVHAIAHIEFNAIDLAWDAVYRFRGMPSAFHDDWVSVASDEARHFALLRDRLATLGYAYGDFDAHNGLWDMTVATAHSCVERMALVPRVLEARGLDVTPAMITRLRALGDEESAAILELILREEVAHVAAGSRWFLWCCERDGLEPRSTFEGLLAAHARGALRGPFNLPARRSAGFSEEEMDFIQSLAGQSR